MGNIYLKIPVFYRSFFVPAISVLFILVSSVFLGPYLLGKISVEQQKISELTLKNQQLETKQILLASQNKQLLLQRSQAAVNAVPSNSPTLPALSSTGSLARENQVALTDFRVTEKKDQKGSTLELTINLEGTLNNSLEFLKSLKNRTPLLKVSEIRSSIQGGVARSKLIMASIWGPLPGELGKAEDPIEALTKPEEEIADKFTTLEQESSNSIIPSKPQGRNNPFTQ